MLGNRIGLEIIRRFAVRIGKLFLPARAGDAGFCVDHDSLFADQALLQKRGEREDARRRVAARICREISRRDPVFKKFRQSVYRLTVLFLCRVLKSVPRFIDVRIVVTEIPRKIDDAHARF